MWRRGRRPLKLRALLWAVNRRARVRLMGLPRRHARGGGEAASLMLGCFERALYPKVSRAAKRLAPELRAPADQGCCGALHAHNGESERGRALAAELGDRLPGTIVTTSGGCAAHLASVLGRERVKELSQWLAERDGDAPAAGSRPAARASASRTPATCATASASSRSRGPSSPARRVRRAPGRRRRAAARPAPTRSAPDDSERVLDRHLDEIAAADLDAIVVVNPGCYRQLEQGVKRRGLRTRVVHIAELAAEAL